MKRFILIMFLLINSNNLFAQKEFMNWIFGRNAGISFNTPDLKPINIVGSQLNTWEGCSSVSDTNGNLIFYSDGTKVWNKNHQLMPNGINLLGYYSASQSSIVVKNPADPNQFYLFSIDGVEQNKNGLSYSIIDMTLDNGLGNVVSSKKNINLIHNTVENICTVRHTNKQDSWIINYSTQQNSFLVFLLTKNGIDNVPVKSPGFSTVSAAAGYSIKSSKSGSMVAFANQRTGSVEVYDFDKSNGTLKKKYNIKTASNWAYAVEFSPNERFLYASTFIPCQIIQYDLSLADESQIRNNAYILGNNSATFFYGLIQIAPDKKIYIAKDGSKYLATIDFPDELGKNCNYVENSFLLIGTSGLGLPNYSISEYYANATDCAETGPELVSNGSFDNDFDGFYSDYNFLKDPPWANNGVYTITNDPHSFMSPWATFDDISPSANGKMFLTDAGGNANSVLIGTNISVKKDTKYIFSLWAARVNDYSPPEIEVKINNVLQTTKTLSELTGIWSNVEFVWNSSSDNNAKIEIFDANSVLYGNDFVIDEISLKECLSADNVFKISSNAPICEGDDLLFFADSVADAQYHWYGPNGFTSDQQNPIIKKATIDHSGKYYCYYMINAVSSDTVSIDVIVSAKPIVKITAIDKTRLCPGDSTILSVPKDEKCTYLWSPNGETSNKITVKNAGLYKVKVTNQYGCFNTDSVVIKIIPPLKLQSDKPLIDFGELDACQPSKIDSIKITNIDSEDATIISIISTDEAFTLISPLPVLNMQAGKAIIFKVKFSPNTSNSYSGDMILISECGDTFSFSLKGSKLKSSVEIYRQSINFGTICIENNRTIDTIVTIFNNGTDNTVFQEPVMFDPYKVISPIFPLTLKKGESIKVTIRYSTTIEGIYNTKMKFPYKTGSCPDDTLILDLQSTLIRSELITQSPLINMPEMSECGFAKDTIVTIKNTGNTADTVYNIVTDKNCKYISTNPLPIIIKPGDSVQITLRWNPVSIDTVTSKIILNYKPCDKFLIIIMTGRKYNSELSTLSQLIQMPDMCECEISKDTIITIKNTGKVQDTIYNVETDINSKYIEPLPLPLIIKPGDSVKIKLQWVPVSIDSVTSFVKVHYNPCDKILPITMTGRKNGVGFFPFDTLKFDEFILCRDTAFRKNLIVQNKNCSKEIARITDAIVDSPSFRADIPKNDSLPYDGTKTYNISFLPKCLTDTSAILEIHYMPCNIIKKIVLKGIISKPELSISGVDFGEVLQNKSTVKEITLTNYGNTIDTITKLNNINPPISYELPEPQFPIIINPGDSVKIKIRYSPLNRGYDTISISAEFLPCSLNSSAKLIGSSNQFAKTEVYIDSTKANTGDTAKLHLILRHSENLLSCGIVGYKALFRYNATLLAPTFNSDLDNIINEERIMQISGNIPINFSEDNYILKEMKFIVGLGNSECTVMKLDTVIWVGGPYEVEKENGKFCVNNICPEGGNRLINPNGKIAISSVKPNPSDNEIEVKLQLVETSGYRLIIINSNGQTVKEITKPNSIKGLVYENIEVNDLASGVYNLILQTESEMMTKMFLILR